MSKKLIGLAPIFDQNTRLMIIGTFPSIESLRQGRYYANERNHFWDFMYRCLQPGYPALQPVKDYIEIPDYNILLKNHIGIWDIIYACERVGNSDEKIKNVEFNEVGD